MKRCITYQTEPKHVVIMNARNAATAFYPEYDYDEGQVSIAPGKRLGLISQIPVYPPEYTVEDVLDTAVLLQKIEGEEEVEKMDALLSLAITGGDFDWI